MTPPPIDAAEFDAHKDMSTIIVEFLEIRAMVFQPRKLHKPLVYARMM